MHLYSSNWEAFLSVMCNSSLVRIRNWAWPVLWSDNKPAEWRLDSDVHSFTQLWSQWDSLCHSARILFISFYLALKDSKNNCRRNSFGWGWKCKVISKWSLSVWLSLKVEDPCSFGFYGFMDSQVAYESNHGIEHSFAFRTGNSRWQIGLGSCCISFHYLLFSSNSAHLLASKVAVPFAPNGLPEFPVLGTGFTIGDVSVTFLHAGFEHF